MTNFISGFLGLCSAYSPGACTEVAAAGYARQPISFGSPRFGLCVNSRPFGFQAGLGIAQVAARAVYDAPTGGNLLVVMPHATPRGVGRGQTDGGDVGYITLLFNALVNFPDGEAYSASIASGATVGQCYDALEVIGTTSAPPATQAGMTTYPLAGNLFLSTLASSVTSGAALVMRRGVLQAQSTVN